MGKETGVSVSADWLKEFVARNGSGAVTDKETGEHPDTQKLNEIIDQAGEKQPESKPATRRAKERVKTDEEREEERAQRDQEKRDQADKKKREAQGRTVKEHITNITDNVSEQVSPLVDRVGSIQTVGGIGLLLAILIILLFVVVSVNAQGDTRLKQLWYMLSGRATLVGRVTPTGSTGGAATTQQSSPPPGSLITPPQSPPVVAMMQPLNGQYRTSNF